VSGLSSNIQQPTMLFVVLNYTIACVGIDKNNAFQEEGRAKADAFCVD